MQTPPPRRRAVQARSRETVERILAAASGLIVERGAEAATMTEIAQRAGVAMGSLYQYFPDKAGVMAALFEQHAQAVRARLTAGMQQPATLEELAERVRSLASYYFDLHREDALVRGLWAAIQTDPALQALDVADSLANARMVFDIARPLYRRVDDARLMTTCALSMQLSVTAARFTLAIPPALAANAAAVYGDMLARALLALEEG